MRIGSLFSGVGGLDMAVEESFGGEVIWQSEVDKAASKVLAHRFPCAPNLGDITAVDWKTVEPVDVLCGGFPCQDVSSAGKRAGIKDGTRSGLWSVFADAIGQLRPPFVVIENVRGLLSARAHRNLEPADPALGDDPDGPVLRAAGAVLGDLADLGYDAQWATVAAASVGAPHRRERVFIVAQDTQRIGLAGPEWATIKGAPPVLGGRSSGSTDAPHSPRDGRDEGRPESAGQQRGFDAAVCGDGHVELLPTPRASDPSGAESRSSAGFRPQLGEVVREFAQPHEIAPTEDHGSVPVFPADRCSQDSVIVGSDCDGVTVGISGSKNIHNTVLAPELAGTKPYLLPTPRNTDGERGASSESGGLRPSGQPRQKDLNTVTVRELEHSGNLLPTPAAADGQRGQDYARANRGGSGGDDLVTAAVKAHNASQWGKYAAAITRWEQIAGPAPAPTEPNRNGKPRLNPAFSEWMMGWPPGWVTDPDIGISRNDQLRIIGNGVCPQQAIAALRFLLSVSEVAA